MQHIAYLKERINKILYKRVREFYFEGANFEINQDKEFLKQYVLRFQFSPILLQSLDHADEEYQRAYNEFHFKTCIDHLRSFLEHLLWESALNVAHRQGVIPPEN